MIWRSRLLSARSASSIALSWSGSSGREASEGFVTKRWNHNGRKLATVFMHLRSLFRSTRRHRYDGPLRLMNAPPVEAFEQGRELGRAQPQHPVIDLRPAELATFQSLRDQHHTGAVPE